MRCDAEGKLSDERLEELLTYEESEAALYRSFVNPLSWVPGYIREREDRASALRELQGYRAAAGEAETLRRELAAARATIQGVRDECAADACDSCLSHEATWCAAKQDDEQTCPGKVWVRAETILRLLSSPPPAPCTYYDSERGCMARSAEDCPVQGAEEPCAHEWRTGGTSEARVVWCVKCGEGKPAEEPPVVVAGALLGTLDIEGNVVTEERTLRSVVAEEPPAGWDEETLVAVAHKADSDYADSRGIDPDPYRARMVVRGILAAYPSGPPVTAEGTSRPPLGDAIESWLSGTTPATGEEAE